MKNLLTALVAGAAALALGACAMDDEGFHHHHARVGVAVGYDGFYDDAYGPFYDGYWGDDGSFYYSDRAGHPFRRDEGHHFRHDASNGFHEVHGQHHEHGGH